MRPHPYDYEAADTVSTMLANSGHANMQVGRLPAFFCSHTIDTCQQAYQCMQKLVNQFSRCERALSSVSFYM